MAGGSETSDLSALFFQECEDLLESLTDGLDRLGDNPGDADTLGAVFRAVHSIKGGAASFDLNAVVHVAHRFETVLAAARDGHVPLTGETLAHSLKVSDLLCDLIGDARAGHDGNGDLEASASDALDLLEATTAVSGNSALLRRVTIEFAPLETLFANGNEVLFLFKALSDLGKLTVDCLTDDMPLLTELDPETCYLRWSLSLETDLGNDDIREVFEFVDGLCTLRIADDTQTQSKAAAPRQDTPAPTLRVDLDRVERLANLAGELIVAHSALVQEAEQAELPNGSPLLHTIDALDQITRDIQESVMTIRAQPVKQLFQRVARALREAAAETGKSVRLETDGERTEIDKTMIERLSDPLTHIIRNAVDHGIEHADDRLSAGKTPNGTVSIVARQSSGRVVIEVSDDGRGLDLDRVRETAEKRGLLPEGAQVSDRDLANLILVPGFSTAKAVTSLSGRGVGLDVVATELATLGGDLSIASEPGQGMRLTLSLPLTLAVMDGLVVHAADQTLVVPLTQVSETIAMDPDALSQMTKGEWVMRHQSRALPFYDLAELLAYRSPSAPDPAQSVLLLGPPGQATHAVAVDQIQDQRQVVIKALNAGFVAAPGVSAATILGSGRVALIVDPLDVLAQSRPRDTLLPLRKAS